MASSIASAKKMADVLTLKEGNGEMSFDLFNTISKLAELKFIDWLTGDIYGRTPPEPYINQKTKDFIAPFIAEYPAHAVGGKITRPADYYQFENMYLLGDYAVPTDCDGDNDEETDQQTVCNTCIELLDGSVYNTRCKTYIKGLEPSFTKPIAKEVGNTFQFNPADLGSVKLEYYRYPKYGQIVPKFDPVYNEEVVDEALSTNYEWNDNAIPILVWFIVDMFANRTANDNLKATNAATGKTPKG